METRGTDPDAHLAQLPEEVREDMVTLDSWIAEAMPGRQRVVWEGTSWGGTSQMIIGYGDLVQPRPRGQDVEWFIVGLARQQNHMSVHVNAVDGDRYLLSRYADRLGRVKTGAAAITIKRLDDLERRSFEELVARAHELCAPDR